MNKLHYQILALTILIGAPFLVSMLTQAIPGVAPQTATVAFAPSAPAKPDYMDRAPDVMAGLPEPLAPPEQGQAPQGTDLTQGFGAAPTLDTSGISVDPANNPAPDAGSAPPPAMAAAPVAAGQDNMPPPEPEPDFREGRIPQR